MGLGLAWSPKKLQGQAKKAVNSQVSHNMIQSVAVFSSSNIHSCTCSHLLKEFLSDDLCWCRRLNCHKVYFRINKKEQLLENGHLNITSNNCGGVPFHLLNCTCTRTKSSSNCFSNQQQQQRAVAVNMSLSLSLSAFRVYFRDQLSNEWMESQPVQRLFSKLSHTIREQRVEMVPTTPSSTSVSRGMRAGEEVDLL